MDEVRAIIIDGLSNKVRGALQFTAGDDVKVAASLIDQGVDSLSAVTIGSKNLNIDIPMLKILGGASITDLADEAASRLTPEFNPLARSEFSEEAAQLTALSLTTSASDTITFSIDSDSLATPPSPPFS